MRTWIRRGMALVVVVVVGNLLLHLVGGAQAAPPCGDQNIPYPGPDITAGWTRNCYVEGESVFIQLKVPDGYTTTYITTISYAWPDGTKHQTTIAAGDTISEPISIPGIGKITILDIPNNMEMVKISQDFDISNIIPIPPPTGTPLPTLEPQPTATPGPTAEPENVYMPAVPAP